MSQFPFPEWSLNENNPFNIDSPFDDKRYLELLPGGFGNAKKRKHDHRFLRPDRGW